MNRNSNIFFSIILCVITTLQLYSQTQFTEILRCGGSTQITYSINDNDSDGVDDLLEQRLLENFMPVFIRFDDDDCPGPSPSGITNDTNLVICRIFAIPPQYLSENDIQLLNQNPDALAGEKEINTTLVWFPATLIAHCALLYGEDCGLTAHTADVEGFTFNLEYIGNIAGGWRFDSTLGNWKGKIIQTTSHAGTVCEKIETLPRLSPGNPYGYDTIFASPDKHGNYLTIAKCNSGFLCDPSCNGIKIEKKIKVINAGEENAPLISDLGTYYSEYSGESPWSESKFLESQGGSAGKIKDKLLKELSAEYVNGIPLDSCFKICDIYDNCFHCDSSIYNQCLFSCDTITPDTNGAYTAVYNCNISAEQEIVLYGIEIYPNPASNSLHIARLTCGEISKISVVDVFGKEIFSSQVNSEIEILNMTSLQEGIYFIKLISSHHVFTFRKVIVIR